MSADGPGIWLIGYDIRQPRRLKAVHRYMSRRGLALQYSLFAFHGPQARFAECLAGLEAIIDPKLDDVRAYPFHDHCPVWTHGRPLQPEGIEFACPRSLRLLMGAMGQAGMTPGRRRVA